MVKEITRKRLLKCSNRGYVTKDMTKYFSCSRRTIQRKLAYFGIKIREHRYSVISDEQLTDQIADIINQGDELGEVIIDSRLKRLGCNVQRYRIRQVLQAIIPEEERALKRIKRRKYFCRAPLSLVHIDTYHKCVRWRFVLHSAIDGFSRKILYMHLSNNNKASTALSVFKKATFKQMPSRLRIDKGSENRGIMAYFLYMRGPDRSSVIAGKSVHNIRIERHWRDTRALCMGKYRKRFLLMEEAGILDHRNEADLYCLHKIFFPLIEKSVRVHTESWNLHKHRSLRHRSPSFVFKEALRDLKQLSLSNNKKYTELRQKNWKSIAKRARFIKNLVSHYNEKGIVVPRIQRPIRKRDEEKVERRIQSVNINWRNAVKHYRRIRKYVDKLIERNDN